MIDDLRKFLNCYIINLKKKKEMYDMEDESDTSCKEANLKHKFTQPLFSSTFTDAIYSQSQRQLSSSIDPLSSSSSALQCNPQYLEGTSRAVKLSGQSLSAQVREYYHKYSRTNLDQYFSLPGVNSVGYSYQCPSQMSNIIDSGKSVLMEKNEQKSTDIARGRRKWERPRDIIGQSSSTISDSQIISHHRLPTIDLQSSSPEDTNKYLGILESHESSKQKINSPTSSVTSNRPLEWDNGADLGYANLSNDLLSHDNCPSLLRLDPEGRTCPNADTASGISGNQINKLHSSNLRRTSKPDAHSTQTINNETNEFSDDIEVTPIIKSHLSGVISGHVASDDEHSLKSPLPMEKSLNDNEIKSKNISTNTPKSSLPIKSHNFKLLTKQQRSQGCDLDNSLKKSSSMNVLAMPLSIGTIVPLTMRSQSEFNLHAFNNIKDGGNHPTNFYSTSSITTIVPKPLTCDKNVQTNIIVDIQSKGIQVSELTQSANNNNINSQLNKTIEDAEIKGEAVNEKCNEAKIVLPNKITSSIQRSISNIPINSNLESENNLDGISQMQNGSAQSRSDYETDDGGRASNSFEYFPGNIYQNPSVNNDNGDGTMSRISSSIETRISYSTMPNTSSSFDEKLWGNSDNLLQDLERSLHILKSLVDANNCDKQVKKRLIHHVIKRLVNAKYTDDKIEHDLTENVPWNPDDTRNKVYRTGIIQAFANKQKQQQQQNSNVNTDDDEEEAKVTRTRSTCGKPTRNSSREQRKIIDLVISTENSDIFDERNTDRTDAMQDGRKARMGLRNDDRHRHHRHQHHRKNININTDKSESSECFLPQSQGLNYKEHKTINNKPTTTTVPTKSQISSTTPNITSSRDTSSQCEINERIQQRNDKIDWRLPTTISERRFDYDRSTSRLGTATRLIDYVEMEKKNQLVWINSEINHLSNLKKLLEEPKNYENINDKKHLSRKTIFNFDKRSSNSTSTSFDLRTIDKQWSSHGNIAERCDKLSNSNNVRKTFTKRNSCTQTTAININNEFSGCNPIDIASAPNVLTRDTSNVHVQTYNSTLQSSRGTSPWSPRRYCRQHSNKRSNCHCQRPTSTSPTHCRNKPMNDGQSVGIESSLNSNKDTKNLLNDQCKSEFNDITEYQDEFGRVNQQHRGCCCGNSNLPPTLCQNNMKELPNDFAQRNCRDELKNKNCENNNKKIDKPQEVKSCRVCGTVYNNDNRQCQCKLTYMKPIAYELSFEDTKKIPIIDIKKPRGQLSTTTVTLATNEACETSNCSCSPIQPQLKDYLTKNKPEFVDNVEMRKRYMREITQLRQLKKEKRKQLLAMASPNSFIMTQKTIRRATKSPRKISDDEMKIRLRMRYLRLSEVRNKRRQREKEEQTRRNHLMAKIFCKKLQQKVLGGQVDVSQSVSVISNL